MFYRLRILFLLTCLVGCLSLNAQSNEEQAIRATIDQLFTAMRNGDSTLLASTFAPEATLQTVVHKKDGSVSVKTDAVSAFVQSVGKPHPEVYDERIRYEAIHVDGYLAAVWTPYQFFVGSKFSHCGVNSFQLVKIAGNWKILYIIDTRRKDNCLTQ